MGHSEEDIKLAVKRISNIIKNDKAKIICVNVGDENTIYLELENGMNFELSASEVMYQADEERASVDKFDRDDVIQEIADDYIEKVRSDIFEGDTSFLNDIIIGNGMKTLNDLTNKELALEYKELFNKDIIIND